MSSDDSQAEQPEASSPGAASPSPVEDSPVGSLEPMEAVVTGDESHAAAADDASEDRLFGVVALGLMALLLICIVMVLIANGRPPAGL